MENAKSSSVLSPKRAAAELLPLLRRSDESVETVRALIQVHPRDITCMEHRGIDESTIAEARSYRGAVLVEFEKLIQRREIR